MRTSHLLLVALLVAVVAVAAVPFEEKVDDKPVDRDPRKQEKEARKQEKEARKQEREARKQGKDAKWREKTQEWREPVDRDPRKQEKEARKQEKEARKQEKDAKWREKTQEWREKGNMMSAEELEAAKKDRKAARKEGGEFKKRSEAPWGNKQDWRDLKRKEGSGLNRENRKKAQGLVDVLIEPKEVLPVTLPLAEEDEISYMASREAFMMYSYSKAGEYNLTLAEVREELRDKLKNNQEKTRTLITEAVKQGMSIWQAKTGIVLAQMKDLEIQNKSVVDEAKAKALAKRERMPPGARDKQFKRTERRHQQELEQIKVLKTDEEKVAYVLGNARSTGTARVPQILK